ncbi:hypothetical protein FE783_06715 [Paenibacillus mesophilus]|uniref:alpha/beta hydrolase family protein n=1 Tax=Paenibacillus mesophilus TaxID=2582849 RepID=UPI00110F3D52|nr:hypothetical protein [Paenibacillus mesophilus]TMV51465.1 hypothetical protein FE783_06715 [Paenibacillus mesophilus]
MKAGRIIRELRDRSRPEPFGTESERSIVISIYYPIEAEPVSESARTIGYADLFAPAADKALRTLSGMGVDPDHLKQMESGIIPDASPKRTLARLPVMLYSPAYGVVKDMYNYNILQLVNDGFIVVAVGSTHESIFTVFPDGRFLPQANEVSSIRNDDFAKWNELLNARTADLRFVLNELERLNRIEESACSCELQSLFDMSRIGVVGHSLGGAAAVAVLRNDPRIRCAVLMDPSFHLIPELDGGPITKPVLLMRQQLISRDELQGRMSAELLEPFITGYEKLASSLSGLRSIVSIPGTGHMSFCDVPLHFNEADAETNHAAINRTMSVFMSALYGQD